MIDNGLLQESPAPRLNNGAFVLETALIPGHGATVEGSVVLAWLPDNAPDTYATWWVRSEDGIAFMGAYFDDLGEAYEDYRERAVKGR